jgi:uncharacterized protein (TIGR02117 family)
VVEIAVVCVLCGLADCGKMPPVAPYTGSASRTGLIYIIAGGWHTEIGLPLGAITGPLATLKPEFPNARFLVFGWGARDYYMARNPGIGDILRAMAPGPAVMLVIPLQMPPEAFYGASNALAIHASPEDIQRLAQFLWDYLAVDKEGPSRPIGSGPYPQSVFYASVGTYNLGHTCNTWTAEALRVAGLPVSAAGVVFASQVLDQLPPLLKPVANTLNEH